MTGRDRVFAKPLGAVKEFEFNETVVRVFPDMINRSVPGYDLMLHLIGLYADIFVTDHSRIYDLGCALGASTLVAKQQTDDRQRSIVAVDFSRPMIDRCLQQFGDSGEIDWVCGDILSVDISNASMVILNLTLQFLDPADRMTQLKRIYSGLNEGGILVLSEKVSFESESENQRMIELHQAFKKSQGYSELEISQKRSALENVMQLDEDQFQIARLLEAGFSEAYQCLRCLNFVSYLAIK